MIHFVLHLSLVLFQISRSLLGFLFSCFLFRHISDSKKSKGDIHLLPMYDPVIGRYQYAEMIPSDISLSLHILVLSLLLYDATLLLFDRYIKLLAEFSALTLPPPSGLRADINANSHKHRSSRIPLLQTVSLLGSHNFPMG